MAFACIHIPDFPVQAVVRGEPFSPYPLTGDVLCGRALVLVDGEPLLCRVAAASAKALAAGIEIGMARAQVEQFPGVEIRRRSSEQERNAHAALLDLGNSFSPHVEDTTPETILLDLAGLDTLFGGAENVAQQLAQGARDVCGLAAHVAVAANPDTALHAARGFAGVTVIADGEEAARLGPLPIAVLGASAKALETFERWGVRNCAALAALPVPELSERLGAEGVQMHQWARGAGQRSLRLAESKLCFEEELALEYDVIELEPLAFLLNRLLESLCARLEARALAASALRLRLMLARHGGPGPVEQERVLNLPVPARNAKLLLNLLRLQLQSDPPGAPVRGIFLTAEPAQPRATQGGFFVPSGPDPEKLELTLAKLEHLVGQSHVGSPQLADTHRPDAFLMRRFVPSAADKFPVAGQARPEHRSGFRIFRPALAVRVEMRAGQPAHVFFHRLRGTVLAASGPWRSSGDWWEKDAWQQEEWDIEIQFAAGREKRRGLYRLAYDKFRREWLVRGTYD